MKTIKEIEEQALNDMSKIIGKKSLSPGLIVFENLLKKYIKIAYNKK